MPRPLHFVRATLSIRLPSKRVLFGFWILLLIMLSFAPDWLKRRLHTTGHFHYLGHLVLFALTATVATWRGEKLRGKILRASCILGLGIALESAEAIAYHGWLEKRDLVTDAMGVALGLFISCNLRNSKFVYIGRKTHETIGDKPYQPICVRPGIEEGSRRLG